MMAARFWCCLFACAGVASAQDSAAASRDARTLFAAGDFGAAAASFEARLAQEPDDAELAYNLAVARWRSGDRDGAETAAEQAAALSKGELRPLRDGLVGNLRFESARAAIESDLPRALELAQQARVCFARGAAAAADDVRAPLVRNLERALRLVEEIEKKIEEQREEQEPNDEQRDPQQDQDSDESSDDESAEPEPSPDQPSADESEPQDPSQAQQPEEQGSDEPQDSPQEPEPSGDESEPPQEPQPRPGEGEQPDDEPEPPQPTPAESEQPKDEQAPEEPQPAAKPRELSEEEARRLLRKLEQLQREQAERRAAHKRRRPPVERDW